MRWGVSVCVCSWSSQNHPLLLQKNTERSRKVMQENLWNIPRLPWISCRFPGATCLILMASDAQNIVKQWIQRRQRMSNTCSAHSTHCSLAAKPNWRIHLDLHLASPYQNANLKEWNQSATSEHPEAPKIFRLETESNSTRRFRYNFTGLGNDNAPSSGLYGDSQWRASWSPEMWHSSAAQQRPRGRQTSCGMTWRHGEENRRILRNTEPHLPRL